MLPIKDKYPEVVLLLFKKIINEKIFELFLSYAIFTFTMSIVQWASVIQ